MRIHPQFGQLDPALEADGVGATGWGLSIHRQLGAPLPLPPPEDPRLAFFMREPWPSVATGTDLALGTPPLARTWRWCQR